MNKRWKRNDADIQHAIELREQGNSYQHIADVIGCSVAAIYKYCEMPKTRVTKGDPIELKICRLQKQIENLRAKQLAANEHNAQLVTLRDARRERILEMHGCGMTLQQIGSELCLTRERVRQVLDYHTHTAQCLTCFKSFDSTRANSIYCSNECHAKLPRGAKMSIRLHDNAVRHAAGEWLCYQCKRWLCRTLFSGTGTIPITKRCRECANYNIRVKYKTHTKPFEPRETDNDERVGDRGGVFDGLEVPRCQ